MQIEKVILVTAHQLRASARSRSRGDGREAGSGAAASGPVASQAIGYYGNGSRRQYPHHGR
ncbi:MAG: hypothetical protein AUG49_22775 [Catenulispora sp. 13_1_20CM_3_70_7]|nr:MAG: hypothetical protein AUG49_22775 [Catenulispora sp. 13_1_20CM_3_70_7]